MRADLEAREVLGELHREQAGEAHIRQTNMAHIRQNRGSRTYRPGRFWASCAGSALEMLRLDGPASGENISHLCRLRILGYFGIDPPNMLLPLSSKHGTYTTNNGAANMAHMRQTTGLLGSAGPGGPRVAKGGRSRG